MIVSDNVLIVTGSADSSATAVINELSKMGQKVIRFNVEDFPHHMTIQLSNAHNSHQIDFHASIMGAQRKAIKSVWLWKPQPPIFPANIDPGIRAFAANEVITCLNSLYSTLDAKWMNSPIGLARVIEDNKLFQLREAARIGMAVPQTMVTNDPDKAVEFATSVGGFVALKTLYATAIDVGDVGRHVVYTKKVDAKYLADNRQSISVAPVLLQKYIEKKFEVRATIVGNNIYACAIMSQELTSTEEDWRRSETLKLEHKVVHLPEEITRQINALMTSLGLRYGAIDLIVTPKDEIIFLEINPNGQWYWIEKSTGLPIARAIAEELALM